MSISDRINRSRNRHNTVVFAQGVDAAQKAGYPRGPWCVVTPRSIKRGPRGMQAHFVVAVDLTDAELKAMLLHDSVWPAFVMDGAPQILHVTTDERDG